MDCQRGTKIVLDEEKIMKEGKYNLEELYKEIDEMAVDAGLIKKDKLLYMCKGDEKDLAAIYLFNYEYLLEEEWFTKYISEWVGIDNKEGDSDLIKLCREYELGTWV